MKQYNVTGMSCAACSSRVEKAVSAVDGVTSCNVNLLTNSMAVDGTADDKAIISAVKNAGYGASLKGSAEKKENSELSVKNEMDTLKRRLFYSAGFLIVLMYFSMGYVMFDFPVPEFFNGNYIGNGILQLVLSAVIMVINQKFFVNGFKGLINKSPNMDTLVAIGSSASFIYSTYALFQMTVSENPHHLMHEFYFESAAMILTLITLGKLLETYSKGKTTDALKSLMDLSPKTATIIKNGKETIIPADKVKKGDIFVVRSGESIAVDGIILEGNCSIDESALTGESIPVDKNVGDTVSSATINQSGFIKCEAQKVGEDTTLSQIIKMVSEASATKAPVAKTADKVSGIFVPMVIAIAVITIITWLLIGQSFGFALARGISVLVISCPCALGLATPVAIMVGNGIGAKNGILFKTALSLEETGKISTVAFDKTGTITNGVPEVTDIFTENISEMELLQKAYSLEIKSEHPLAKAIVRYAEEQNIELKNTENFKTSTGSGLSGKIENSEIIIGNLNFISKSVEVPENAKQQAVQLSKCGKTTIFICIDKKYSGMIALADKIKSDSAEAIQQFKKLGIHTVMITGDNEETAKTIAKQCGIDDVIAGVLPDGKEKAIQKLKKNGKVCMVGDGINDSPALKRADTGIAIGSGTDIAIDTADVVLMKSTLRDAVAAVRLSRQTLKNIHENLFWAFFYNTIGIPLAAGVLIPFGIQLNPMFAAAAMSLSSFCVVSNALRLNLFDIYNSSKDKKIKTKEREIMTVTLKIEGMMCGHCEARVKKCLEKLPEVDFADVSYEKGTAEVTLNAEIPFETLKQTVEEQDYTVLN